jgi:hypothetical protein
LVTSELRQSSVSKWRCRIILIDIAYMGWMTINPRRLFPMKHSLSIAVALGLTGLASASLAGTRNYGDMTIELPAGYEVMETNSALILKRMAGKGNALIAIGKPANEAGRPEQAIAAMVDQLKTSLKGATRLVQGDGENANGAPMRYETWIFNQPVSTGVFVAVAPPNRVHVFNNMLINLDSDASKAAQAEFDDVVRTVKLDGADKGFRLEPEAGAGGLEGLYTHFHFGLVLNGFGGMDTSSEMQVLYFERDGLFSREPPAEDNLRAFCAGPSRPCGTYSLKSSAAAKEQLELRDAGKFGMFARSTAVLRKGDETLTIGADEWKKIKPAHDLRLDGHWEYFTASSGTTAYSSGSFFNSDSITFTRDGRFIRSGGSGVSSSQTVGNTTGFVNANTPRPEQKGTYVINGYALTLTQDDGTVRRLSFFTSDEKKLDLLVINGLNYTHK